jgi:hypothetical protein
VENQKEEDKFKIDFKEIGCEDGRWIELEFLELTFAVLKTTGSPIRVLLNSQRN